MPTMVVGRLNWWDDRWKIFVQLILSFAGVEEVASLLSGTGLYTCALSLRARHEVSCAPALASLASAYASLSTETVDDSDAWRWLTENDIAGMFISLI